MVGGTLGVGFSIAGRGRPAVVGSWSVLVMHSAGGEAAVGWMKYLPVWMGEGFAVEQRDRGGRASEEDVDVQ